MNTIQLKTTNLVKITSGLLALFLLISISACSSGHHSPVVPPSGESQFDFSSALLESAFTEQFSLNPITESRSAANAKLSVIIENLKYDLNAGWASFDLRLANSGKTLFDVYLNIESINPQGEISVNEQIRTRIKFGIIASGTVSPRQSINLTFPSGQPPRLTGNIEGKTSPLFKNARTVLHTDSFASHAYDESSFGGNKIIADQVIVRFKKGISLQDQYSALDKYRLIPVGVNLSTEFIQADILNGRHPDDVVFDLIHDPVVDHAEVNTITFTDFYPNDPVYDPSSGWWEDSGINSWGPRRIQAPEAFDFYNDRTLDQNGDFDVAYNTNGKIIFFILDTGYKFHEDLGIDTEDQAFLNLGLNIVDPGSFPNDDNGHGTLISGIATAEGNNGIGMAGMAWNGRIVPIKTNDYAGMGDEFRSGIGVSYAKEVALDYPEYKCVGNMSYGTHSQNPDVERVNEESAFRDAWPVANLQFVAATGNCGNNPNPDPGHYCHYDFPVSADNHYPAAFQWVIAAAASTYAQDNGKDTAAGFSNWGLSVDVSAPGTDIFSSWVESPSSYRRASGTSCSSPMVAGLFAMIWSRNPSLTKTEIRKIIRDTAEPMSLPPEKVGRMGTGRINAYKALFAARYLKPQVGEKICSGDIQGDGLDETALGLNGYNLNTGMMFIFNSQNQEMTDAKLEFGVDNLVTGSVFADLDGNRKDKIVVSLISDPGGIFTAQGTSSNQCKLVYLNYNNPAFSQHDLFSFGPNTSIEHITSGDVDGDMKDEIIVALQTNPSGYFAIGSPTNDLSLVVIDNSGVELKRINLGTDKLASSVTCGDIDFDGRAETIFSYIDNPAGVFAISGGTNTGKLAVYDDAVNGFNPIANVYAPQPERIIEQVLAVELDSDPQTELILATLDNPGGYLENVTVSDHASLVALDDVTTSFAQIARLEFNEIRRTFQLTKGHIHPGYDDKFWAWFMVNPIDLDYVSGTPGGSLLMVPFSVENGQFVQKGPEASSPTGYWYFSGCIRNGDPFQSDNLYETALYAIAGDRPVAQRYFEYHEDTGSNIQITWEYKFPSQVRFLDYSASLLDDSLMNPRP